jgi:hypoxanthine phosphoribosyltransferase
VTSAAQPHPSFAHASEAELARILDFYGIRWRYEPDTFPIGWSLDGDVVESFSPDFYLPDLELYLELTTLKQKLVRKKNRKLRRLRELYPDVRIKLFYARDFRMLLLKFGRLALLDDLSGTPGQATPPRPADQIVTEAGAAAGLGASPDDLVPAAAAAAPVTLAVAPVTLAAAPASVLGAPAVPSRRATSTGRGRRRGRRRRHDGLDAPVGVHGPAGGAIIDPYQEPLSVEAAPNPS